MRGRWKPDISWGLSSSISIRLCFEDGMLFLNGLILDFRLCSRVTRRLHVMKRYAGGSKKFVFFYEAKNEAPIDRIDPCSKSMRNVINRLDGSKDLLSRESQP